MRTSTAGAQMKKRNQRSRHRLNLSQVRFHYNATPRIGIFSSVADWVWLVHSPLSSEELWQLKKVNSCLVFFPLMCLSLLVQVKLINKITHKKKSIDTKQIPNLGQFALSCQNSLKESSSRNTIWRQSVVRSRHHSSGNLYGSFAGGARRRCFHGQVLKLAVGKSSRPAGVFSDTRPGKTSAGERERRL